MILDLGTGNGKAVLRRARREPSALVIGLDADAAAMRAASARAARSPSKGGLPNALFLAAAAEELPGLPSGAVDLVTVVLPWGSLLRGLVRAEPDLLAGLTGCLREGGELELLLSVGPRDRSAGVTEFDRRAADVLIGDLKTRGLYATAVRQATPDDVDRLSSSWAKRLGVPNRRVAWLLRFCRPGEPERGEGASGGSTPAQQAPSSH